MPVVIPGSTHQAVKSVIFILEDGYNCLPDNAVAAADPCRPAETFG